MPTARPRVLVTETDELAAALATAERAWPEEKSRARLLTRLALLGSETLADHVPEGRTARRLTVLTESGDRYRGLFPKGYRESLRSEWPE